MVIGKEELTNRLAECQGGEIASKAQASRIINSVIGIISEALVEGNKVRLSDVGILETVDRAPRKGRCFESKAYDVPARRSVRFTTSKTLKSKLNP